MSVAEKVSARVSRMKRGTPFSITGFYALGSQTAVQKALSRLAQEGVIERVSKGLYVRPKPIPSLPSVKRGANAEQIAKAWAKTHGYKLVVQGQEAAYRLGLQTQAPMKRVYWSNGPTREFRVGNQVVEVRHITEQKLRWARSPEGALFRGLLVTPPESIGVPELKTATQRLSLSPKEAQRVVRKLRSVPALHHWQAKLEQLEQTA